ncbi:MAG: hypothetical protein D6796_13170 [Caldilineae bacterium]|nr:MAG: hypothetical protein D6796_13170 [Caldilineae bacterium]
MKHKQTRLLVLAALLVGLVGLACGLGGATEKVDEVKQTAEAAATTLATAASELKETAEIVATQVAPTASALKETAEALATAVPTVAGEVKETAEAAATTVSEQMEQPPAGEQPAEGEGIEEATLEATSVDAALEQLSSYRSQLAMRWEGQKANGEATSGEVTVLFEQVKEPLASHMQMQTSGDAAAEMGGTGTFEWYRIGDTFYMQNPEDGSWISFTGEGMESTFSQGFFSADDMIDLPETARRSLLPETVNGISTWHYTFDKADLGPKGEGLEDASGEVWIAREGGYPVKFILDGTGAPNGEEAVGNMFVSGTYHIEYELLEVNTPLTIEPPAEAQTMPGMGGMGGMGEMGGGSEEGGYPMMDDAEVQFSMQGMLNYYTHATLGEVIDFYKSELAAQGWTANADAEYIGDDTALLTFSKDGEELNLTLNVEADGRVNVTLVSGQ